MTVMASSEADYFGRMVRSHPVRTGVFSVGPIAFGLVQMVNSYVNGGSLLFAAVFLGVMAMFAAMATRYHLVTFRVSQLDDHFDEFR